MIAVYLHRDVRFGEFPHRLHRGTMATAHAVKRSERMDARVTREEKETIEIAANLRGTSSSDF